MLFGAYEDERVVGIIARDARDDGWSNLGVVIARPSTIWERANAVVDAWSRKGGVKLRQVRDICRTIQAKVSKKMLVTDGQSERTFRTLENMFRAFARHRVHVSSIPDRDGMYIEVLERDVEVVRNVSSYEYCLPSID
nr:hypothetical protein [Tanacetum cinerariifolium]